MPAQADERKADSTAVVQTKENKFFDVILPIIQQCKLHGLAPPWTHTPTAGKGNKPSCHFLCSNDDGEGDGDSDGDGTDSSTDAEEVARIIKKQKRKQRRLKAQDAAFRLLAEERRFPIQEGGSWMFRPTFLR